MSFEYGLPSQEEAWKTFAVEVGGEFYRRGGSTHKVVARVSSWEIVLDTVYVYGSGDHTRVRAVYLGKDDFSFVVRRKSLFTPIAELLGARGIEIGDRSFDRRFALKSNDGRRVRELLSEPKIQRVFMGISGPVHVQTCGTKGLPDRVSPGSRNQLHLTVPGVVRDIGVLRVFFQLFRELLSQLQRMGAAEPAGQA
jgi:hypothetical protein